ncbi:MAG: tetratricopeptide repeat protein [Verrucomicrobiia bacterium]
MTDEPQNRIKQFVSKLSAILIYQIAALFVCLNICSQLNASEAKQESNAFKSATALFNDGFYEQSDKAFHEFIVTFQTSRHIPEALLLQAEARFKLKNFTGAIAVLEENFHKAGNLADEYLFWIAESQYALSNYTAAVEKYRKIISQFPKSKRIAEASYRLALCHFHLNQFQTVVEILASSNSIFSATAKNQTNYLEQSARANLLLAETYIRLGDFSRAESTLKSLSPQLLPPELQWRWHYLICSAFIESQKLPEALSYSTNLFLIAEKTNQKQFIAQSAILVSSIYDKLNRKKDAIEILNKYINLFNNEQRKFALLKIIELSAAMDDLNSAATLLENYANTYTNEPTLDLVLLTAGEFRLKEYWLSTQKWRTNDTIIATPAESNLLKQAYTHFNRITADFPKSQFLPKAQLQRGWCLWLGGDFQSSRDAFQFAAEKLPHSEDQAIALFKLGDVELLLNNYTNSIRSYNMLISNYINEPKIKNMLIDQALYQLLRASISAGDLHTAEQSVSKLLSLHPDSDFSARSMLLMGQTYNRIDKPQKARELLESFINKFQSSPLVSEAILAIAKSYIKEGNFNAATVYYDKWFTNFSSNSINPQAEFDRAVVHYHAGGERNAVSIFTNFIQKYPTNELAALARLWIGLFYFRHHDYTNAESQFQLIFQNTNFQHSAVAYQAKMMAGKTAFARQGFKDAADYFRSLINDEKCPPELLAEAWFALGDTLIEQGSLDPSNKTQQFNEAIVVFNKIPNLFPTNNIAFAAYGRIADCYLQLAAENPENYQRAREFYQKVIDSNADITLRSQAEVGLGTIAEKLAALKLAKDKEPLLKEALDHYLNIIYARNVKPDLNEQPDPFWVKKASLNAINILESTQQWSQLISLCERLKSIIPAISDSLDKKISTAQEKLFTTTSK